MRAKAVLLALAATGCSEAPELPASSNSTFDPLAFFAARSSGAGTIHQLFSDPVPLRVQSSGSRRTRDGLVLTQVISEGAKPPRKRVWTIRRIAPGRFEGTLVPDAVGPVTMRVRGPRASINYEMTNGMAVEQQLALQPRGQTLCNRLEVWKFGIRVAWVGERIERVGRTGKSVTCPGA